MKEYNHTLVLKEESITNVDLRNKIYRNIEEEVGNTLTYEVQKNTCFKDEIFLLSFDFKEIQNNLMKLWKY